MSDTDEQLLASVNGLRDRLKMSFVEQYDAEEDTEIECAECGVGIMLDGTDWVTLDNDSECSNGDVHSPDDSLADDAWQRFDESMLEAYVVVHRGPYGDQPQHVVIVTGTGGPHVEAEIKGDRVTARGWWGSDSATASGRASDDVVTWADGFTEQYADES